MIADPFAGVPDLVWRLRSADASWETHAWALHDELKPDGSAADSFHEFCAMLLAGALAAPSKRRKLEVIGVLLAISHTMCTSPEISESA